MKLEKTKAHTIEAVVDRLVVREGIRQRLADSIESALRWGEGKITVLHTDEMSDKWAAQKFSTDYSNPNTGFTMPKLTPKHFSFNSHLGACPACHGIGTELFFDPDLMVDGSKTLTGNAIKPWRSGNKRMKQYYGQQLDALISDTPVAMDVAFKDLPQHFKDLLFYGSGDRGLRVQTAPNKTVTKPFDGLVTQMQKLFETSQSELTRKRGRNCGRVHTGPSNSGAEAGSARILGAVRGVRGPCCSATCAWSGPSRCCAKADWRRPP